MNSVKISNKTIGGNNPTFIIAEAGVNHNGKVGLAKKLVDIAVNAGADAVKFQTYKSEDVVIPKIDSADYSKKNLGKQINQLEMLKAYELDYKDFKIIKEYCDKKRIIFLSTPHSFDAIDFLEDLVPAYKFGSGDITNLPTLIYAAKKDKPIILGTGMSTLNEVEIAINAIKKEGNEKIIALHCTTNYPCPFEEVNLRAMITMQKELDCLIGYSDHTLGINVPIIATALGAKVIEKHFTISKDLPGPDHKASLEPNELKTMVKEIRNTEKILGSFEKKPTESEKKIMKLIRKSIVAKKEIDKGVILKEQMISIKRPGMGIKPYDLLKIIGKKTKKHISKNEMIKENMVE
ncbi:MAG TPA: N-acetylneuraminate synthase [Candidatus Lokiarchaeia archaeon]